MRPLGYLQLRGLQDRLSLDVHRVWLQTRAARRHRRRIHNWRSAGADPHSAAVRHGADAPAQRRLLPVCAAAAAVVKARVALLGLSAATGRCGPAEGAC
jgi:hypothetical protein